MASRLIWFASAILWMQVVSVRADEVRRTVTVSAQSDIEVAADEALVSFRIHTQDPKILEATALNDSRTREVIQKVKGLGIADEHLRMIDFDVSRQYSNTGVFQHFYVDRSFACRIHDFTMIEQLLSALLQSGVEHIDRVKYQVKNQRLAQRDARKMAFEIAKEKATSLAELSEMKLGKVISVKEDVEFNQDAGGFGNGGGVGFGNLGGRNHESVAGLPSKEHPRQLGNSEASSVRLSLCNRRRKRKNQRMRKKRNRHCYRRGCCTSLRQ